MFKGTIKVKVFFQISSNKLQVTGDKLLLRPEKYCGWMEWVGEWGVFLNCFKKTFVQALALELPLLNLWEISEPFGPDPSAE